MNFREVLGTSNRRRLKLIELLYYQREGVPSEKLLDELDCTLPILLNDVSLINEMQEHFFIKKKKGLYSVKFRDNISIGQIYADALSSSPEFQIIEQLLYESCDSISMLSRLLFLSPSNTQRYLKKIESYLNTVGIQLYHLPLRLEGKESVIRHFYYRYFIEKQFNLKNILPDLNDRQLKSIEQFVLDFTTVNGLYKKYIFQKRVTYNVFISLWRIKNGHEYPKEELRTKGLVLPEKESINQFGHVVSEVFQLNLTDEMMRDCLWLSFSDAIIFSSDHLNAALGDNPRYRQMFNAHLKLSEDFAELLGESFDEQRLFELTTVLVNDVYLYEKKGEFIAILRKSRTTFLGMLKIMHHPAIDKVTKIVRDFVHKNMMYRTEGFITNYVYLLLTAEVDSLELLASQDKTLLLLLLSDLSPTEEHFISKIIEQIIYGNFKIHHFEDVWDVDEDMFSKILDYDGLITTGSVEGLPRDFPSVSMDPYVTPQSIVAIQKLVNDLSEKNANKTL